MYLPSSLVIVHIHLKMIFEVFFSILCRFAISIYRKGRESLLKLSISSIYDFMIMLFCREVQWTCLNKSRFTFFKELYDDLRKNWKAFGKYKANIFESKFVIAKPDLVEIVSRKGFSHFAFRPRSTYLKNDHLTHSIFNLDGEIWQKKRRRLSEAFSTEKLNRMLSQMNKSAEEIRRMLIDHLKMTDVINVIDVSRTYVATVFHCCVFGQEMALQTSDSEFARMAKLLRNSNSHRFKFFDFLSCIVPRWRHIFGGQINNREASAYFRRLIRETVDKKRKSSVKGDDFLNVFMEFMEKSESDEDPYKWDIETTEAHCIVFLLGGFTATSSTIAFTLYELAKNIDVQAKVLKELEELGICEDGLLTPEKMRECSYLDRVIKESLRMYPPFSANLRICSKEFRFPEENLVIPKGKTIVIPVCGLQNDPAYFPEPNKFDPERFNSGATQRAFTYLPFGIGRRACIGERYAIMIIKVVIAKMLMNFKLSTENYTLPDFSPRKFTTTVSKLELHCAHRERKNRVISVIISAIITALLSIFAWIKQRHKYWENLQVPHLKPKSLIFGHISDEIWGKLSTTENASRIYNELSPHRYGGVYHFQKPMLYVRDPELIKNILIKDFRYFSARNFDFAQKSDFLTLHLFNLYGEEWRILRQKLSPTFTPGKMKILFVLMRESAEKIKNVVDKKMSLDGVVEVKDLSERYIVDVISSCVFGLEADALQNPDSEIIRRGHEIVAPPLVYQLINVLYALNPAIVRSLHLRVFPKKLADFFVKLVNNTVDYRKKNGVVKNDFLNILMNLQKDEIGKRKNFNFSNDLLIAQCFVFFIAGFETTANTLTFILYKLAEHQIVQKKLQEEVDSVLKKYDGEITYDGLQEMHYMDQVFNETSRLFTTTPLLFRTCTENYRFPGSDYVMRKGEELIIPLCGLHRDPKYFTNPDVFDPENFSEEAKASRPVCSFLPFGDGPRNCIGMRFGIMKVKLGLSAIMKEFTITKSPEMKTPIELMPGFTTSSKTEILLNFNKRQLESS